MPTLQVEFGRCIEDVVESISKTKMPIIIEEFLNSEYRHFEKNREWLQEEQLFVTVYELDTFLEKVRKEN